MQRTREVLMAEVIARRITGRPLEWARDMALVGGITSATLPALLSNVAPTNFAIYAGIAGTLTGALFGALMPAALDRLRNRVPLWALLMAGPVIGCAWGGLAGALASLPFSSDTLRLGVLAGAIAGGLQFGWWWFPYTFQTVRGRRTWPVMLTAAVVLPLIAGAVFFATMALVLGVA